MSSTEIVLSVGKKYGIDEALEIYTSKIEVYDWVEAKCRFGCEKYGTNYSCPPHTFTPEQTRKLLKEYRKAILVFGKEGNMEDQKKFKEALLEIEKELFKNDHYKAFALIPGPCEICSRCHVLDSMNCIHPEKKRPAVEGMGIDVLSTVRRFKKNFETAKEKVHVPVGIILLE